MQQHKWQFRARFRANAFGWKASKLAIQRINEAVREIRKVKDHVLRAEGSILLLERFWPALQQIDSSSGSLGTAVNNAVHELTQFIIDAPCCQEDRDKWLDRLWTAMQEDGVDFLAEISERWGEICVDPKVASHWADELRSTLELSWEHGGYFRGGPACLSCLLKAKRYDDLLDLVERARYLSWNYRQYGVWALAEMGKTEAAISYAEGSRGLNDGYGRIAAACEKILLAAGHTEEAYRRFAFEATYATTHLAQFRALVKKYPLLPPEQILRDLIAGTPGQEGKWFATAKTLGHFDLAVELANQSPVNIGTLNRAARDFLDKEPAFALNSALACLRWLAAGEFYEITSADVRDAVRFALKAAENVGRREDVLLRITALAKDSRTDAFVREHISVAQTGR
jgi:tetratricopeptide (TPR) repeat protein